MTIKGPLKISIEKIDEKIDEAWRMQVYHAYRISQLNMSEISSRHKRKALDNHYYLYDFYKYLIRDLKDKKKIISCG